MVNTGDGKGKSTAAFGMALRALARGWRVGVVQFLKSGDWKVGEEKVGRQLGMDWWALGDGFTWDSDDIDESEAIAREAWSDARARIESDQYDLLILDDFGLQQLDNTARMILLEIIEDRHGRKSTIIASQLLVAKWYEIIGDSTVADAILDRMVHTAHRLELKGESLRKK